MLFDQFDTRELFARLMRSRRRGEDGMKAVATVIMNRATVPMEGTRVSQGGNVRNILEQESSLCACRLL